MKNNRNSTVYRLILSVFISLGAVSFGQADEFMRWQAREFMATLRYQQTGIATPQVNDIYAREADKFIKTEQVRIATICPGQTTGTIGGDWTFFGARFLPLPGKDAPSFYAVSYLGGAKRFHEGKSFDAIVTPSQIKNALSKDLCPLPKKNLSSQHTDTHGYEHLTYKGHFAPLSWNSLDIDNDGLGDLTFGGLLYLSSNDYSNPIGKDRLGAQAALIRTDRGIRLARLHEGWIYFERLEDNTLVTEHSREISEYIDNSGHTITVIPGRTAGTDSIALRLPCGIEPLRYEKGKSTWSSACITGLEGIWALPGGRGDFDNDGVEDFWISQTMLGVDVKQEKDKVILVSGALYNASTEDVALPSIAITTINGSSQFTDHDGIATTMSPYAGDIDGDGVPDFSFSGHRHMNEAGAMYILFGKDITPNLTLSLADDRIHKIAGPLMSQLAPPYHHWDMTDWDEDGYDDIIVTADNDMHSGFNAGAIYVLSGKKIVSQTKK